MIVDTSALVAVVLREPDYDLIIDKLSAATTPGIGTPTLAELGIVLSARLERDAHAIIVRILDEFDIAQVNFGPDHWREALSAFNRFGRGRHRARLNFGDCCTYAVARLADEPLLCIGDDFPHTDVAIA